MAVIAAGSTAARRLRLRRPTESHRSHVDARLSPGAPRRVERIRRREPDMHTVRLSTVAGIRTARPIRALRVMLLECERSAVYGRACGVRADG